MIHVHRPKPCSECDHTGIVSYGPFAGEVCDDCRGRGYVDWCVCGEPVGNKRRKWKRERRAPRPDSQGDETA